MSPRVALGGVSVTYHVNGNDLLALEGIDLAVAPGEFVTFLGPSGCGKSTLLRVIGGLQAATAGQSRSAAAHRGEPSWRSKSASYSRTRPCFPGGRSGKTSTFRVSFNDGTSRSARKR